MKQSCRNCEYATDRNLTEYTDSGTIDESFICDYTHTGFQADDPKCKHYKARRGCRTCKYLDMILGDERYKPEHTPMWETYECQKVEDEHVDKPTCSLYEENKVCR